MYLPITTHADFPNFFKTPWSTSSIMHRNFWKGRWNVNFFNFLDFNVLYLSILRSNLVRFSNLFLKFEFDLWFEWCRILVYLHFAVIECCHLVSLLCTTLHSKTNLKLGPNRAKLGPKIIVNRKKIRFCHKNVAFSTRCRSWLSCSP